MSENINTKQYWDNRFEENWEQMQGNEQTAFFTSIAIQLMPDWLKRKIKEEKLTLCDFGCANGQAVDCLHDAFQTDISGIDFSESAILQARRRYPQYNFLLKDIVNEYDCELQFDVGYLSNVLEHITDPWAAAQNVVCYLNKYLIVLIPFRETLEIEEHYNKFDLDNIPLVIGKFRLVYAAYKDCADIKGTLYADKQILLVYSSPKEQCQSIQLDSLVKNFEETIIKKNVVLQREFTQISNRICDVNDKNINLIKENNTYLNENKELRRVIENKNSELSEAGKMIDELSGKVSSSITVIDDRKKEISELRKKLNDMETNARTQTLNTDYMKNMIYNLQIENERIQKTISWKITKPLRKLGQFSKKAKLFVTNRKQLYAELRNSSWYKKYFKQFVPQKLKDALMNKYFAILEDRYIFDNSEQERIVLDGIIKFEKSLQENDQVILVFSGVKYIDSEGQRNIRLIHEAKKLGRKIIFAYWRWDLNETPESDEVNMVKIPIDILSAKQTYFFETFFRKVKDKCLIVEFPHPYAPQIIEIANSFGWKTVYDVIDDWEEFSKCGQAGWYRKEVERRVANLVDINIATAHVLRDKIKREIVLEKPYYVISNGVDPNRMVRSNQIPGYNYSKGDVQIGYFGHLTDAWFDWNLLKSIARKHGEWTFHIIGYGAPDNLKVPDNIVLYGKKTPEELPKYAAYWDVAIIPFVNNELTRGVNPIKVFEYLQLRIPVVASNMPEIADYPYVKLAVGEQAFEKAITESIRIDMEENRVQKFIEENTWKNKCIELLEGIEKINKMW